MLSAINEGPRIVDGHTEWLTWVQIGLNFVVPFLVGSYGYLTAAGCPAKAPGRMWSDLSEIAGYIELFRAADTAPWPAR